MPALIEDYALVADGETAALIGRDGSVDWLCWPRFDSDACFAALLGRPEHGRWLIAPAGAVTRGTRRYQPDTMVLETDFATDGGAVRIIDFMPLRADGPALVRIVVGIEGAVDMRLDLRLRFDYGRIRPWTEACQGGFVARCGPDQTVLRGPVAMTLHDGDITGAFRVTAGQRLAFVLRHAASYHDLPAALDAEGALAATEAYWRDWIGRFDRPTQWPEATRRSLLTLKALINRPSGGLIASVTTSLPEQPGGRLNWDYRYCWLRDTSFAVSALLNAGYHDEALRWRDWLLRAIGAAPRHMQIMYRIDGGRHLQEWEADWLPGFRWARPVRVGNAAATQLQVDVFGEVLESLALAHEDGIALSPQGFALAGEIAGELERVWREPDQGLWESRAEPHHYTYSKVMAWVGVDRFLRMAAANGHLAEEKLAALRALRAEIHAEICQEAFHPGRGTFVRTFGDEEVDASLLLLPLVGFLPIDDPRIGATIAAIERELMEDGLVRRHRTSSLDPQGAFLACSFWLADCRNMQGRHDAARAAFERALDVRNDVGLLAEEYNIRNGHLAGNFPLALTHVALVRSALGLSAPPARRVSA